MTTILKQLAKGAYMCPVTFVEAFEEIASDARLADQPVHLLLGNGFSRAFDNDIFSYDSLYEAADLSDEVSSIFELRETKDFEQVVRALDESVGVISCFDGDEELILRLEESANDVREALISVITNTHPERPQDISFNRLRPCARFFKYFRDTMGHIFTLNYDIMLYWVILKSMDQEFGEEYSFSSADGFGNDPHDQMAGHVVYTRWRTPTVHYLHGAMFLFDDGQKLRKITNIRTEVALIDQIRTNIRRGMLPLFVSEGDWHSKMASIRRNPYLFESYNELKDAGGSIFIHGMSLSDNDKHIANAISSSSIERVYVSYRGNFDSQGNRDKRNRAQNMVEARTGDIPLTVEFYNSDTVQVWGD